MAGTREAIPHGVKRQLRQEAGFGCCSCGHPFIEYHHIIPWAADQHYRPDDMMVLCANCHHLCTTGAIGEAQQRALKARPKNIVDGLTRGTLFVNSGNLIVNLAGGQAIRTPKLIQLGGNDVLEASLSPSDGRVLLSAQIQGEDGKIIATLTENEWLMAPNDVWDFEVHPQRAIVRRALGHIAFSADVRNDEIYLAGTWYFRRNAIEFTPTRFRMGGMEIAGMSGSGDGVFITIA